MSFVATIILALCPQDAPVERALEHIKAELPGVMTIEKVFAGFAFLAEGSTPTEGKYSAELNTCIAGIMESINGDWREGWYWGLGGLFLAEVHKRWPDPKVEARLKKILERIVQNQEPSGGWSHKKGFTYGKKIKDVCMIGGLTMGALGNMKAAGIDVPDETWRRGLAYMKAMSDGGGGMAYGTGNPVRDPCATRGVGLMIGMHASCGRGELYGTIAGGVKKRVGSVERGHSFPVVHFFCSAVGNHLGGSYATFLGKWKERLVGMQEGDGGIWMKNHEGIDYERTRMKNNVMGTSVLAVILLLEKGNLFQKPERRARGRKKRSGSPFGRRKE